MAVSTRRPPRTLVAATVAIALALYVAVQGHPLDKPCPAGLPSMRPTVVTLTPSVLQHQSWVGIPQAELAANSYVFACTDGLVRGVMHTDHIELDQDTGLVRLAIATRWVDLVWASGHLDDYHASSAWAIVLSRTYP